MSKTIPKIQFHFLTPGRLPACRILKKFLVSIFRKEGQTLESLDIIFCDDKYLLSLNKRFLNHDFYTDILSFPMSEANQPLIAEMYISLERVRENAKSAKIPFPKEIHRVIIHGVLHFCGYKDKSANDIKKMRTKEDFWLEKYFRK